MILANTLDYKHIDLDKYISKKEGKSISKIFSKQGEEVFRQLEYKYLKEIFEKYNSGIVLSTGGGTPLIKGIWEIFNKNGTTFYLSVPPNKIIERLNPEEIHKRPLLSQLGNDILDAYVWEHLRERLPFYHKADYIIDTAGKNHYEIAADILAIIEKQKLTQQIKNSGL